MKAWRDEVQQILTTQDMVNPVPKKIIRSSELPPSARMLLTPRGLEQPIAICGGSTRTTNLVKSIYGSAVSAGPQARPDTIGAWLVVNERPNLAPFFGAEPKAGFATIRGSGVTVSQLKVSVRYLTAWLALTQTPNLAPIHGVLIQGDAQALLILGESGVGKSWFAKDLMALGGYELACADWSLYDSETRSCIFEDELPSISRGTNRAPHSAPIEVFNGDPDSSQSRYLAVSPTSRRQVRDTPITAILWLTSPTAPSFAAIEDPIDVHTLWHSEPAFTDEALDILDTEDAQELCLRQEKMLNAVPCLTLAGHRNSVSQYRHAVRIATKWLNLLN